MSLDELGLSPNGCWSNGLGRFLISQSVDLSRSVDQPRVCSRRISLILSYSAYRNQKSEKQTFSDIRKLVD